MTSIISKRLDGRKEGNCVSLQIESRSTMFRVTFFCLLS